jgi:hypothetical protein
VGRDSEKVSFALRQERFGSGPGKVWKKENDCANAPTLKIVLKIHCGKGLSEEGKILLIKKSQNG